MPSPVTGGVGASAGDTGAQGGDTTTHAQNMNGSAVGGTGPHAAGSMNDPPAQVAPGGSAGALANPPDSPDPQPDSGPPPAAPPTVIAAAGDVASEGGDQRKTADILLDLLENRGLALILMLGDGAYRFSNLQQYQALYDPTWGVPELKSITRPVPGNHEYLETGNAKEYFDYWNGAGQDDGPAGPRDKGYYSFDLNGWHFVALNSSEDCRYLPCGEGSEQLAWLEADLAAHAGAPCTLAYVHNPRYQNGTHRGDTPELQAIWSALYDANVDVVLAGHEHNYQQFSPMDKQGNVDLARGIRSFVVGMGGARDFREVFGDAHMAAEEKRIVQTSGVLELSLSEAGYAWRYLTVNGTVEASGDDVCH